MVPSGYSPRRFWLWVALALLPLLFARAMVPAGFMASTAGGGIHYVFCGHDGAVDTKHPGDTDRSCPFAQSAGGAPLPTLFLAATLLPAPAVPAATYYHRAIALSGPTRQQLGRAPPVHSLV